MLMNNQEAIKKNYVSPFEERDHKR